MIRSPACPGVKESKQERAPGVEPHPCQAWTEVPGARRGCLSASFLKQLAQLLLSTGGVTHMHARTHAHTHTHTPRLQAQQVASNRSSAPNPPTPAACQGPRGRGFGSGEPVRGWTNGSQMPERLGWEQPQGQAVVCMKNA